MNVVRKTVLSLAVIALVGWLGYSAYQTHEAGKERPVAQVNYDSINNYMSQVGSIAGEARNVGPPETARRCKRAFCRGGSTHRRFCLK